MTADDFDHAMMAGALRMAKRGLGTAAPNPSVGAIIADPATGEVIARGWTQPGGRPHAETEALRRAGSRARGATLYVTLEPCAHHGKTPPCADAIIAAGIRRVVAGSPDPDPRTAGQGFARLRTAGIAVSEGVGAEACRAMSLGHILRVTETRPFVQIKMAVDANGEIARGTSGRPAWVTSEAARARGHLLRAEADAILIGARTLADDDPELTCRLPGLAHRSPVRVVVSKRAEGMLASKIVATLRKGPSSAAGVWIMTGPDVDLGPVAGLEAAGAWVSRCPLVGGQLSTAAVLTCLAAEGITRLLVEGGPVVWRSFATAGFVDEIVVLSARQPGHTADFAPRAALVRYAPEAAVTLADSRRIGDDDLTIYRRS
ncbi:MAG: bifunctional diaminohydroxyphosphoribosylaminopyrimidine deaminase/5-amino-6-(5-phosphoribosylamino)uracil reductase RibD [Hyphomicrobium sp.]